MGLAHPSPFETGILQAWIGVTDDGAIAVDTAGQIVLHNPAASRVTGLAPDAAHGRPWRQVLHLDPGVADAVWRVRTTGAVTRVVADVLCAQGNLRSTELVATPWRDGQGGTGMLLVLRDLAILCRQRTTASGRPGYGSLVGAHPVMVALFDLIDAVAASDAPALIEGERGTGKELVAQLLHARSQRAERPLLSVDCGGLTQAALEAELFGNVRQGTGGPALGRVELAHTGTLLLRRVHELPPPLQRRLIRLLDAGVIERDGDPTPRRVDVRVLAATTQSLEREVEAGRFAEELYHRLKIVRIRLPSLRERLSDLPILASMFLERHARPGLTFAPTALAALESYGWPGNVGELDEAMRQVAMLLPPDDTTAIGVELLPPEIRTPTETAPPLARPREESKRARLLRALSSHGGNRTAAARALGIGRATFYRWWDEAGLGPVARSESDAVEPR